MAKSGHCRPCHPYLRPSSPICRSILSPRLHRPHRADPSVARVFCATTSTSRSRSHGTKVVSSYRTNTGLRLSLGGLSGRLKSCVRRLSMLSKLRLTFVSCSPAVQATHPVNCSSDTRREGCICGYLVANHHPLRQPLLMFVRVLNGHPPTSHPSCDWHRRRRPRRGERSSSALALCAATASQRFGSQIPCWVRAENVWSYVVTLANRLLYSFELMAEPQRDLTPEQAATRLRGVSDVHYLNVPATEGAEPTNS